MPRDAAARRFTPRAMHLWFVVGLAVVAALATGAPVAAGASTSIPRATGRYLIDLLTRRVGGSASPAVPLDPDFGQSA